VRETTPPLGLVVYIVVAILGAIPLLVLSAAAPGNDVWLEYPRQPTIVATVTGVLVAVFATQASRALVVPFATIVIACIWNVLSTRNSAELVVEDTLLQLAPYLVGGLYAVLALMAIKRSATARLNRRRAGAWLLLVGALALAVTLANESWLTLRNLSESGTYRSSSSWPDTQLLSLVTSGLAALAGLAILLRAVTQKARD
jgi:hypothetical protein